MPILYLIANLKVFVEQFYFNIMYSIFQFAEAMHGLRALSLGHQDYI